MAYINRRRFLSTATGFAAALPAMTQLMGANAYAADATGYKALVCVMLKGGLDGADFVLPLDQASHDAMAEHRPGLIRGHQGSRDPSNLIDLGAPQGSNRFGLPAEASGLANLFTSGRASIVANVGPLIEPMTRDSFNDRSARRPDRLFSHNDQQSTWLAGQAEGASTGWGGRMADLMSAADTSSNKVFSALTTSDANIFLQGDSARGLVLPLGEPTSSELLRNDYRLGTGRNSETLKRLITEHHRASGLENPASGTGLLARDIAAVNRRAVDNMAAYGAALENLSEMTTEFPDSKLGRQLAQVIKTISVSNALQVSRQVFYVSIDGFDTHQRQATKVTELLEEISTAVTAFTSALDELGRANEVTLFSASDFGRTLIENGDGTDHGWGGHHFVTGGAVAGGRIIGEMPGYDVGSQVYTKDRGRLIPTTSVDQYAATLGRWFGLNDTDLSGIFPNLQNFATRDLGIFATA